MRNELFRHSLFSAMTMRTAMASRGKNDSVDAVLFYGFEALCILLLQCPASGYCMCK